MKKLTAEKRRELRERYAGEADVLDLLNAYERAHELLDRSLYEFGSELRVEIEGFLGVEPLIMR